MNKKKIIILKEIIKKKNKIKNELKKKIIKSIIQNKKNIQVKRLFLQNLNQKNKLKKNNKICLFSSKRRGVETKLFISRHIIKKLLNLNELQNIKIKSW